MCSKIIQKNCSKDIFVILIFQTVQVAVKYGCKIDAQQVCSVECGVNVLYMNSEI